MPGSPHRHRTRPRPKPHRPSPPREPKRRVCKTSWECEVRIGRIMGHGTSATLVVTIGEEPPDSLAALPADLVAGHMRAEFCRSSIVGWQGYLRDQALCKALVPWGIPSDLYGEDPGVLDDLPREFVPSFLRGYVDGDRISRG